MIIKETTTIVIPERSSDVTSDLKPAPTPPDNAAVVKSKKSRKRAADFMDDEAAAESDGGVKIDSPKPVTAADEPAKKKAKKSKKSKKSKDGELLSADGVNGVVEHTGEEELETATTQNPVSTSMQAEAERTVDHELEGGFGGFASEEDEEIEADDNAAALLAGFDSDTEDKEDEGLDLSNIPTLPKSKKIQKKLEKAKAKSGSDGPGTVYVGRIPHGFYEQEMRAYFSQFGEISQIRLSRNKWTGASKHFAFIEFTHESVAKIAAEAMDNYLMFGHILKCKYAEPGSLHADVWKGANKKYRKIPHEKLERERFAAPKTEDKWQKKVDKEQRKRDKKAEQMKAIGLDMPVSSLTSPSVALQQRLADQDEPKQIEEDAGPTGATEPPPHVPKDEIAVKEAKKSKKEKKSKKDSKDATEAVSESYPAVEATEAPVESRKGKKSKKEKKDATGSVPDSKPAAKDTETQVEAKKEKKGKKQKKDAVEAVSDSKPALESTEAPTELKKEKKSKKGKKIEAASIPELELADEVVEDLAELAAEVMEVAADNNLPGTDAATGSAGKALTKGEKKKSTKSEKKVLNADRKALQAEKKVLRQAQKLADQSNGEPQPADNDDADKYSPEEPAPEAAAETQAELSADFISLGQFDEDSKPKSSPGGGKVIKPWKVKKPKKERKNLVKARGPKSKLVAYKPKPDMSAQGKIPGLPVMGKGKYDKAIRTAHKELKKTIVAERAARGLPPHRVRGEN